MAYTSDSEFEVEGRVQITNEVPPMDIYENLHTALKNDTWKWLLGWTDVTFGLDYKGNNDPDDEEEPLKIVNGKVAEEYGPKPESVWDPEKEEYVEVKPRKQTRIEVNGVLMPENDLFLHEIYRYLGYVYPNHPDWVELLTHNEIVDAFENAAAIVDYKPDDKFFLLVAENLEKIENTATSDNIAREELKLLLRNLTNVAYRRKFYGASNGLRMIAAQVGELASIFPVGQYLTLKPELREGKTLTDHENAVFDFVNENGDPANIDKEEIATRKSAESSGEEVNFNSLSPEEQADLLDKWKKNAPKIKNSNAFNHEIDTFDKNYKRRFRIIDWLGESKNFHAPKLDKVVFKGYPIATDTMSFIEYFDYNEHKDLGQNESKSKLIPITKEAGKYTVDCEELFKNKKVYVSELESGTTSSSSFVFDSGKVSIEKNENNSSMFRLETTNTLPLKYSKLKNYGTIENFLSKVENGDISKLRSAKSDYTYSNYKNFFTQKKNENLISKNECTDVDFLLNPFIEDTITLKPSEMIKAYDDEVFFKWNQSDRKYIFDDEDREFSLFKQKKIDRKATLSDNVYHASNFVYENKDFVLPEGSIVSNKKISSASNYSIEQIIGFNHGKIIVEGSPLKLKDFTKYNYTTTGPFNTNDNSIISDDRPFAFVFTTNNNEKIVVEGGLNIEWKSFRDVYRRPSQFTIYIKAIPLEKSDALCEAIYGNSFIEAREKLIDTSNLLENYSGDTDTAQNLQLLIDEYEEFLGNCRKNRDYFYTKNDGEELLNFGISSAFERAFEITIPHKQEISNSANEYDPIMNDELVYVPVEYLPEKGFIKFLDFGSLSLLPICTIGGFSLSPIENFYVNKKIEGSDFALPVCSSKIEEAIKNHYITDKDLHKNLIPIPSKLEEFFYKDIGVYTPIITLEKKQLFKVETEATSEFNESNDDSNYSLIFKTDEAKRIFSILNIGDEVYGNGLPEGTFVKSKSNNTVVLNNRISKFGTFVYKFGMSCNAYPTENYNDTYKKMLLENGSLEDVSPFHTGLYGSEAWPNVHEAYIDGKLNPKKFEIWDGGNNNFQGELFDHVVHKIYKDKIEGKESDFVLLPSTINLCRESYFEVNLRKFIKLKNRRGNSENLMNVEWLDYFEKEISKASAVRDNINVGTNLMLQTDMSGYYSLVSERPYTDPKLRIMFQTFGWDKDTVPVYAQIGSAGAGNKKWFRSIDTIIKPNIYGNVIFDRTESNLIDDNEDEEGNRVLRRNVYSVSDNDVDEQERLNAVTRSGVERPLFEIPLGEYDIQKDYVADNGIVTNIISFSFNKEVFKNLYKTLDSDLSVSQNWVINNDFGIFGTKIGEDKDYIDYVSLVSAEELTINFEREKNYTTKTVSENNKYSNNSNYPVVGNTNKLISLIDSKSTKGYFIIDGNNANLKRNSLIFYEKVGDEYNFEIKEPLFGGVLTYNNFYYIDDDKLFDEVKGPYSASNNNRNYFQFPKKVGDSIKTVNNFSYKKVYKSEWPVYFDDKGNPLLKSDIGSHLDSIANNYDNKNLESEELNLKTETDRDNIFIYSWIRKFSASISGMENSNDSFVSTYKAFVKYILHKFVFVSFIDKNNLSIPYIIYTEKCEDGGYILIFRRCRNLIYESNETGVVDYGVYLEDKVKENNPLPEELPQMQERYESGKFMSVIETNKETFDSTLYYGLRKGLNVKIEDGSKIPKYESINIDCLPKLYQHQINTIKLPRGYITDGSYGFEVQCEPYFVSTGHRINEKGEVEKVDFLVSESSIFYDDVNNEFYSNARVFKDADMNYEDGNLFLENYRYIVVLDEIENGEDWAHDWKDLSHDGDIEIAAASTFEEEKSKVILEFAEQRFFKDVKYLEGVYKVENTQDSLSSDIVKTATVRQIAGMNFDLSDLNSSDRIIGIEKVDLRSLWAESLEPVMFSNYSTLEGEIHGVDVNNNLVIGGLKNGDSTYTLEKSKFSSEIQKFREIEFGTDEDGEPYTKLADEDSTKKTFKYSEAPQLRKPSVKKSFSSDEIKNVKESSDVAFRYFKNYLVFEGVINCSAPQFIETNNTTYFNKAMEKIKVGDEIKALVALESSASDHRHSITCIFNKDNSQLNPTIAAVRYNGSIVVIAEDNGTIWYSNEIGDISGISEIIFTCSEPPKNFPGTKLLYLDSIGNTWTATYEVGDNLTAVVSWSDNNFDNRNYVFNVAKIVSKNPDTNTIVDDNGKICRLPVSYGDLVPSENGSIDDIVPPEYAYSEDLCYTTISPNNSGTYDITESPYIAENESSTSFTKGYYRTNGDVEVFFNNDKIFVKSKTYLAEKDEISGKWHRTNKLSSDTHWKCAKIPAFENRTLLSLKSMSNFEAYTFTNNQLKEVKNLYTGPIDIYSNIESASGGYEGIDFDEIGPVKTSIGQIIDKVKVLTFDEFRSVRETTSPKYNDNNELEGNFGFKIPKQQESEYLLPVNEENGKVYITTENLNEGFFIETRDIYDDEILYRLYLKVVLENICGSVDNRNIYLTSNYIKDIQFSDNDLILVMDNNTIIKYPLVKMIEVADLENPENWTTIETPQYTTYAKVYNKKDSQVGSISQIHYKDNNGTISFKIMNIVEESKIYELDKYYSVNGYSFFGGKYFSLNEIKVTEDKGYNNPKTEEPRSYSLAEDNEYLGIISRDSETPCLLALEPNKAGLTNIKIPNADGLKVSAINYIEGKIVVTVGAEDNNRTFVLKFDNFNQLITQENNPATKPQFEEVQYTETLGRSTQFETIGGQIISWPSMNGGSGIGYEKDRDRRFHFDVISNKNISVLSGTTISVKSDFGFGINSSFLVDRETGAGNIRVLLAIKTQSQISDQTQYLDYERLKDYVGKSQTFKVPLYEEVEFATYADKVYSKRETLMNTNNQTSDTSQDNKTGYPSLEEDARDYNYKFYEYYNYERDDGTVEYIYKELTNAQGDPIYYCSQDGSQTFLYEAYNRELRRPTSMLSLYQCLLTKSECKFYAAGVPSVKDPSNISVISYMVDDDDFTRKLNEGGLVSKFIGWDYDDTNPRTSPFIKVSVVDPNDGLKSTNFEEFLLKVNSNVFKDYADSYKNNRVIEFLDSLAPTENDEEKDIKEYAIGEVHKIQKAIEYIESSEGRFGNLSNRVFSDKWYDRLSVYNLDGECLCPEAFSDIENLKENYDKDSERRGLKEFKVDIDKDEFTFEKELKDSQNNSTEIQEGSSTEENQTTNGTQENNTEQQTNNANETPTSGQETQTSEAPQTEPSLSERYNVKEEGYLFDKKEDIFLLKNRRYITSTIEIPYSYQEGSQVLLNQSMITKDITDENSNVVSKMLTLGNDLPINYIYLPVKGYGDLRNSQIQSPNPWDIDPEAFCIKNDGTKLYLYNSFKEPIYLADKDGNALKDKDGKLIQMVAPKYISFKELINNEGFVVSRDDLWKTKIEDTKEDRRTLLNIGLIDPANGLLTFTDLIDNEALNAGDEHYIRFKILTTATIFTKLKNLNNKDYFTEINKDELDKFPPDRVYFNRDGLPHSPITINNEIYGADNSYVYYSEPYKNANGNYIYECNNLGQFIEYSPKVPNYEQYYNATLLNNGKPLTVIAIDDEGNETETEVVDSNKNDVILNESTTKARYIDPWDCVPFDRSDYTPELAASKTTRIIGDKNGNCVGVITLTKDPRYNPRRPIYDTCQDWFKNEFYVKGQEKNPFWQIIKVYPKFDRHSKSFKSYCDTYQWKKTAGRMELEVVPQEERFVSAERPVLALVKNDSVTLDYKSSFIDLKNGELRLILGKPAAKYRASEKFVKYGISFKNSFYLGKRFGKVWQEGFSSSLDETSRVAYPTNLLANYTVNSTEDFANLSNKDASIVEVSELALLDKNRNIVAYATFPDIEYRTASQHISFTCFINKDNLSA